MSDLERLPIAGRERVCCYITRGRELLTFMHDQMYDDGCVGTHIIGGGWEQGETYEQTALRETLEESGLVLERGVFLGTTRRVVEGHTSHPEWNGKVHVRHYFWLEAPPETPDAWSHTVSSGELDQGHLYHFRFKPLERVELAFGLGEMLERLNETARNIELVGKNFVLSVNDLFEKGSFGGIVLGDSVETVIAILGQPDKFEYIDWSKEKCLLYGTFSFLFSNYGLETVRTSVVDLRCTFPLLKFDPCFLVTPMNVETAILLIKSLNVDLSIKIEEDNCYTSISSFGHKEFIDIRPNPYNYHLYFSWWDSGRVRTYVSIS